MSSINRGSKKRSVEGVAGSIFLSMVLVISFLLPACSGSKDSDGTTGNVKSTIRAAGNDPFWILDMDFETGTAQLVMKGEVELNETFPITPAMSVQQQKSTKYAMQAGERMIEVSLYHRPCTDPISGDARDFQAILQLIDPVTRQPGDPMNGCASYNNLALLTRIWRLVEINGKSVQVQPNGKVPTITYDFLQQQLAGNGGCNAFSGPASMVNDSIRVGVLISTKMACPQSGIEGEYMNALRDQTLALSLKGNNLMLKNEYYELKYLME